MQWLTLPDFHTTGIGLCMKGDIHPYTSYADDFLWNTSKPIKEIILWGAFSNDKLPSEGKDKLTFEIIIHEDNNNKPGNIIWKRFFTSKDYEVELFYQTWQGWHRYFSNFFEQNIFKNTYQYNFVIDNPVSQHLACMVNLLQ